MPTSSDRTRTTLPEVLVTISLIAALAFGVVPAISAHAPKGAASRAAIDVAPIRHAVEQFVIGVRRRTANS